MVGRPTRTGSRYHRRVINRKLGKEYATFPRHVLQPEHAAVRFGGAARGRQAQPQARAIASALHIGSEYLVEVSRWNSAAMIGDRKTDEIVGRFHREGNGCARTGKFESILNQIKYCRG